MLLSLIFSSYPSLQHYKMVKENTFMSTYLNANTKFKNIQLKFKFRNGVSDLGVDLNRQKRGSAMCKNCGSFESLKHFIFYCSAYNKERAKMFKNIQYSCDDNIFNMFIQNHDFALCMLLGDHDDALNSHFMEYVEQSWIRERL